ncbi:hypothetical protein DFR58_1562 [Anaerobacterium chartisolvens]|uniref:Uncharacterized protein n=1 Tax=Anaerobacterium chartisolvens TaxID=1297424 RepID=A0A369ADW3_9FIRM|nr:hypothetical protein [Anaerobacterium chartisolvens]RCX07343.1 hypothetical protein DFR58_1562 [Anaerobacterium chartisolvens]
MSEEELERLLGEIYSQDIAASEKLIQKTRARLSESMIAVYMIALAVSINLVIFMVFLGVIIAAPYSLVHKLMLYTVMSCLYNSLVLAAYRYREGISKFFQKLQGGLL